MSSPESVTESVTKPGFHRSVIGKHGISKGSGGQLRGGGRLGFKREAMHLAGIGDPMSTGRPNFWVLPPDLADGTGVGRRGQMVRTAGGPSIKPKAEEARMCTEWVRRPSGRPCPWRGPWPLLMARGMCQTTRAAESLESRCPWEQGPDACWTPLERSFWPGTGWLDGRIGDRVATSNHNIHS
jgi:hypothetical protein